MFNEAHSETLEVVEEVAIRKRSNQVKRFT